MKTPVLRCSDTVDSSAARKRVNKVGARTHPCFSPWLISKGSVVDPPIDTLLQPYHRGILGLS